MSEPSIQILSSTESFGERVFQLAPEPSDQWWAAWDWLLNRWLEEVGRLPPDVEVSGSPPDEIVASGITEDNAADLDRALSALVLAVNRERRSRQGADPELTLENLERDADQESQSELRRLAEGLREKGFSVKVAPIDGPFHAILQESAEHELLNVLNVVLGQVEAHAIDAAIGAVSAVVADWARSRLRFRSRDGYRATATIWGPDGRPLRRVPLPDPAEESEGD